MPDIGGPVEAPPTPARARRPRPIYLAVRRVQGARLRPPSGNTPLLAATSAFEALHAPNWQCSGTDFRSHPGAAVALAEPAAFGVDRPETGTQRLEQHVDRRLSRAAGRRIVGRMHRSVLILLVVLATSPAIAAPQDPAPATVTIDLAAAKARGSRVARFDDPSIGRAVRWSVEEGRKAFTLDLPPDGVALSPTTSLHLAIRAPSSLEGETIFVRITTSKGNYWSRPVPVAGPEWRRVGLPFASFSRRGRPDPNEIQRLMLVGFRSERAFTLEVADVRIVAHDAEAVAARTRSFEFESGDGHESARASTGRVGRATYDGSRCLEWRTGDKGDAHLSLRPVPEEVATCAAVRFRLCADPAVEGVTLRLYDRSGGYIEHAVGAVGPAWREHALRLADMTMTPEDPFDPSRPLLVRWLVPNPNGAVVRLDDLRFVTGKAGTESWVTDPPWSMRLEAPGAIDQFAVADSEARIVTDGGARLHWDVPATYDQHRNGTSWRPELALVGRPKGPGRFDLLHLRLRAVRLDGLAAAEEIEIAIGGRSTRILVTDTVCDVFVPLKSGVRRSPPTADTEIALRTTKAEVSAGAIEIRAIQWLRLSDRARARIARFDTYLDGNTDTMKVESIKRLVAASRTVATNTVRWRAVTVLNYLGGGAAVPALFEMLDDPDGLVSSAAVDKLKLQVGAADALVKHLATTAIGPDPNRTYRACFALHDLKVPIVKALLSVHTNDDPVRSARLIRAAVFAPSESWSSDPTLSRLALDLLDAQNVRPEDRGVAMSYLASGGAVVPELIELAGRGDPALLDVARRTVARMKPHALIEIQAGDGAVEPLLPAALAAMRGDADDDALEVAKRGLAAADIEIRCATLRAIGGWDPGRALVERALGDSSARVRATAVDALASEAWLRDAVPLFLKALDDPAPAVANAAASALLGADLLLRLPRHENSEAVATRLAKPAVREAWIERSVAHTATRLGEVTVPVQRANLLVPMLTYGSPAARSVFRKSLESPHALEVRVALLGLLLLGDAPDEAMLATLKHRDVAVRWFASRALAMWRVAKAGDDLASCAPPQGQPATHELMTALARSGSEAATARLRAFMKRTDAVGDFAAIALAEVDAPSVRERLRSVVTRGDELARALAARALARLGDEAARAVATAPPAGPSLAFGVSVARAWLDAPETMRRATRTTLRVGDGLREPIGAILDRVARDSGLSVRLGAGLEMLGEIPYGVTLPVNGPTIGAIEFIGFLAASSGGAVELVASDDGLLIRRASQD